MKYDIIMHAIIKMLQILSMQTYPIFSFNDIYIVSCIFNVINFY